MSTRRKYKELIKLDTTEKVSSAVDNLVEVHIHIINNDSFEDVSNDESAYNFISKKWDTTKIPEIVTKSGVDEDRILESMKYRALSRVIFYDIVQNHPSPVEKSAENLRKIHSSFYNSLVNGIIEKIPEEKSSSSNGWYEDYANELEHSYDDENPENEDSDFSKSDVRAFLNQSSNSLSSESVKRDTVDLLVDETDMAVTEAWSIAEDSWSEFISNKKKFINGVIDILDEKDYEKMEDKQDWAERLVGKVRQNTFGRRLHNLSTSYRGGTIIFGAFLCSALVMLGLASLASGLAVPFMSLALPDAGASALDVLSGYM